MVGLVHGEEVEGARERDVGGEEGVCRGEGGGLRAQRIEERAEGAVEGGEVGGEEGVHGVAGGRWRDGSMEGCRWW